jgi:preprotein translocase subunit SecG
MSTVILVIHITATLSMIVIILLQRSEGGALGIGGGGGGLVSGRGAANLLTRMTAILAAIFFTTSISLGILSHRTAPSSAVGVGAPAGESTPVSVPAPIEKAPESLPALRLPKLRPETPSAQTAAPAVPAPAALAPAQPQLPQSQ